MSKYTPKITTTREFDGDTVAVTLSRMKRKHMLLISGKVVVDENGDSSLKVTQAEMLEAMSDVLRECVVEMSGLFDADGEAISLDTVLDDLYFFELAMWILSELMVGSRLSKEDEKKSLAPQDVS